MCLFTFNGIYNIFLISHHFLTVSMGEWAKGVKRGKEFIQKIFSIVMLFLTVKK